MPAIPSGMNANAWSAYFVGFVTPPTSENYTFQITVDDGTIVNLNGTDIINSWSLKAMPTTLNSSAIALTAGNIYPLNVQYYKGSTDAAQLNLKWKAPIFTGGVYKVITKQYLSH